MDTRSLHQSVLGFFRAVILLAAAVSVLLAVASARAATAGTDGLVEHTATLEDGRERRWFVYRPAGGDPGGVVFVLHGSGGSAARVRALTARRFERLADEQGFLVVYPEGVEGNWNGCRRRAPFSADRLDVDDVAFLAAVRARHAGERALVFGFSGGGHMALRLALEAPELVDAVAVVGASLPAPEDDDCRPVTPDEASPAVLLVNGTADPINPYAGGDVLLPAELGGIGLGRVLPSDDTARRLAARAGHEGDGTLETGEERDGNPATAVTFRRWRSPGLPEVALVTVSGGGHTIPQPGTAWPPFLGPHSADLHVPLAVTRFWGQSPFAALR